MLALPVPPSLSVAVAVATSRSARGRSRERERRPVPVASKLPPWVTVQESDGVPATPASVTTAARVIMLGSVLAALEITTIGVRVVHHDRFNGRGGAPSSETETTIESVCLRGRAQRVIQILVGRCVGIEPRCGRGRQPDRAVG